MPHKETIFFDVWSRSAKTEAGATLMKIVGGTIMDHDWSNAVEIIKR